MRYHLIWKVFFLHKIDNSVNSSIRRFDFSDPDFLVIIPTYNHPETLEYAVCSVLNQSYKNFRLVIICDGVTQETRNITAKFNDDSRVTVLDFPKSSRVGEEYRDIAIRSFPSRYVTYLGDDDLFLADHLKIMKEELLNYDFTHPLPVYLTNEMQIRLFAKTNLREKYWINWHIEGPPYKNSISMTGVAHTRDIYFCLNEGWTTTPEKRWADHYMWCKFFSLDGIRLSTSKFSTTIKSPQRLFNSLERKQHLGYFYNKLQEDSFTESWNEHVRQVLDKTN